jgi:hypothetical protein
MTSKSKEYSVFFGCPEGYHKRASYKSTKGKTVKTACVKSTTVKNEKKNTLSTRRHTTKLLPGIRTLSRQACPVGMIERKEFARKYSTAVLQEGFRRKTKSGKITYIKPRKRTFTYVEPKCVKDIGLPGKGQQTIGPLRKGELSKHGYTMQEKEENRHKALRKAVKEYGGLGVYRKLDAVAKLTVRTIPEASKIYEKDRNWVKEKFGTTS